MLHCFIYISLYVFKLCYIVLFKRGVQKVRELTAVCRCYAEGGGESYAKL